MKSNVFVALENVSLEHERDLTNSSAERVIIPESFILLDEILNRANTILSGLVIREENIKKNLKLTKGLNMAEAIMIAMTKKGMGRQEAHELLRKLAVETYNSDREYSEVLKENSEIKKYMNEEEIDEALKPENYIGTAVEQVRKVLDVSKHERA